MPEMPLNLARMIRNKGLTALIVSAAALGVSAAAWACASFYSGSLLDSGDAALTEKPTTRFAAALAGMTPKTGWRAVPAQSRETESATAGILLLHKKLFLDEKLTPQQSIDAALTLREYALARAAVLNVKISAGATGMERLQMYDPVFREIGSEQFSADWSRVKATPEALAIARARLGKIIPEGIKLPEEFSQYLTGIAAWQSGDAKAACEAWKKVVALPADQRRNQGVFAAYMLGIAGMNAAESSGDNAVCSPDGTTTPAVAKDAGALRQTRDYFRMARRFAIESDTDPCGLGTASLGLEAKTYLTAGDDTAAALAQAVTLYLEQNAAGDPTALSSIQQVVRRVLALSDAELAAAAKNPVLRPLVTAYITAEGGPFGEAPSSSLANAWIRTLEAAGTLEPADAVRLAFLCYQQGEYVSCMRWLQKSPAKDPLANWLMARLLLREGRTPEAANLMAKIVRDGALKTKIAQPPATDSGNGDFAPVSPWRYEQDLIISEDGTDLASRIIAEHAVLSMSQKRYAEALDSFLRCGLEDDAAYVAEYVMTTKELQEYADKYWADAEKSGETGAHIRHLLAKRLMRERRWQDARPYFPKAVLDVYDQYVADVQQAYNTALSAENRAAGFWLAAANVRDNGKALFAAEAGPAWSSVGGWRENPVPQPARLDNDKARLAATPDEINRINTRPISKEDRDHRYRAAELASYAAALLPNDDERASRILATAGVWLKNRDPRAAEPFYKMLAIRCPETPLGKLANTLHWFPPEVTGTIYGVWENAPRVQGKKVTPEPAAEKAKAPAEPATPEEPDAPAPEPTAIEVTAIQITKSETPANAAGDNSSPAIIDSLLTEKINVSASETTIVLPTITLPATPTTPANERVFKSADNRNRTSSPDEQSIGSEKILPQKPPTAPEVKTAPEIRKNALGGTEITITIPAVKPSQATPPKPQNQPTPAPAPKKPEPPKPATPPPAKPAPAPDIEPIFDSDKTVIAPAAVPPAETQTKPRPPEPDVNLRDWK